MDIDAKTINNNNKTQNNNSNNNNSNNHNNNKITHWLLYDEEKVPRDQQQLDNFVFVDKAYLGYYAWPKLVLLLVLLLLLLLLG